MGSPNASSVSQMNLVCHRILELGVGKELQIGSGPNTFLSKRKGKFRKRNDLPTVIQLIQGSKESRILFPSSVVFFFFLKSILISHI